MIIYKVLVTRRMLYTLLDLCRSLGSRVDSKKKIDSKNIVDFFCNFKTVWNPDQNLELVLLFLELCVLINLE